MEFEIPDWKPETGNWQLTFTLTVVLITSSVNRPV